MARPFEGKVATSIIPKDGLGRAEDSPGEPSESQLTRKGKFGKL